MVLRMANSSLSAAHCSDPLLSPLDKPTLNVFPMQSRTAQTTKAHIRANSTQQVLQRFPLHERSFCHTREARGGTREKEALAMPTQGAQEPSRSTDKGRASGPVA